MLLRHKLINRLTRLVILIKTEPWKNKHIVVCNCYNCRHPWEKQTFSRFLALFPMLNRLILDRPGQNTHPNMDLEQFRCTSICIHQLITHRSFPGPIYSKVFRKLETSNIRSFPRNFRVSRLDLVWSHCHKSGSSRKIGCYVTSSPYSRDALEIKPNALPQVTF